MPAVLFAVFLVSLLTLSGCAALAYLFPHNHSQD